MERKNSHRDFMNYKIKKNASIDFYEKRLKVEDHKSTLDFSFFALLQTADCYIRAAKYSNLLNEVITICIIGM